MEDGIEQFASLLLEMIRKAKEKEPEKENEPKKQNKSQDYS